ncbi:SurA N-terminal domain-containing protein [Pseudodesulfovibrio sediminis]|uniref:Periplasmic chaperone PpiD n=1 Tax=Pseudodesulfovibrio sediminis TaxID=2810563 RepID=A0ABM8I4K1_9BACT|nr:SurA N-terminal domain-containing protein [Pseudodesulfovibrio sediminis]BCS88661.1 peptidylprolyl isomerase [Pseudodesulfovibrio sediminis]
MLEIMRENASGWIVKILFAVIIVVFVFAFGMSGLTNSGDPVMASVDGKTITRAEFQLAYNRATEIVRQSNPQVTQAQLRSTQFKQLVMSNLMDEILLLNEADKLGVSASDDEVVAGISAQSMFKNADGKFDPNIYQGRLRQLRMTPAEYEADFKKELMMDKVRQLAVRPAEVTEAQARHLFNWLGEQVRMDFIEVAPNDFIDTVTVSEDEIKTFFDANTERFTAPAQVTLRYLTFTPEALAKNETVTDEEIASYYEANKASMEQKEQVRARHILVMSKDSDPEEVQAAAAKKIEKVLKKAQAGEDFAALAKEYSEGPSGPNGGELGWFARGAMVPDFEAVAFATKKGEISGLVKTRFGWHIIKVEDHKDAKLRTLDEAKDEIRQEIAQEKAAEQVTELLDQSMDRLVSGMSISDIATELKLTVETSEPMPAAFLGQILGIAPEVVTVLEELPAGTAQQTPVAINGGYILAEKVEDIAPALIELDKAKPTIIKILKEQKATEKAKAKAESILAALTGSDAAKVAKTYAARIMTSESFDRQGNIPALGASQELTTALFNAKDDAWLPTVYALSSGMVVARLNERIPASDATWAEQKATWMEQVSRGYSQEMLAAYMEELNKNATKEIARPDLLQ